jgi:thiamine biosynthesis lipoprotein
MGTTFAIVFYARDASTANQAFQVVFDRIRELDNVMSDYDSASEILRLCAASPTPEPVAVSPDLFRVLDASHQLSEQTDGAFDVTVGPLSKLWRRARRRKSLPDPDQLREARQSVGYQHLCVHRDARSVALLRPDMRIDLGGIAKGFAADEALETLRELGIHRALVNAGGDVAVSEPPPGEPHWKVDIAPIEPDGPPAYQVGLVNSAVATSGDAWQYVEIDGQRYSHILDPRTGRPLSARSSVSVIAPTGMAADSLASAVSVLGVGEGLTLIERTPDAAALIVSVEDDQRRTHHSSRLAKFLVRQP